jgi:hypothetical protein
VKNAGKSLTAIQKLLAERTQIERWLERLGLAGDSTPEAVRERVKADYEARLKELLKELSAFGDELNDALKRQLATREGLSRQEKEAAERLAEAEVRHAVGEYDETKWREVHAEYLGALVRVREELKTADEELQRLEEAVRAMEGPAKAEAAPLSPGPKTSTTIPPATPKSSSSIPPGMFKARKSGPNKQPVDELAFLKSVTDDDKHGIKASRASGQQRVPEHIKPPPSLDDNIPPMPPRQPVDVGASGVAPIDKDGPGKRLTAALEKSLKCKECGTMNMPTEWYCEKCGAELSESL